MRSFHKGGRAFDVKVEREVVERRVRYDEGQGVVVFTSQSMEAHVDPTKTIGSGQPA